MNTATNNEQLSVDPATHYWIELRGQLEVEWLQSFDSSIEIILDEPRRQEFTVFHVHTDQSGVIGLIRRLHGLGLIILKLQVDIEKEV